MAGIPNNQKLCELCGQAWRERSRPTCSICGIASHLYRKIGTGQKDAIKLVNREVKNGRMLPPTAFSCVDCAAPATAYEHRDYNNPLDVVPTCRACNAKRGYAIPKKMTFDQFMSAVKKSWQWTDGAIAAEHFEPIRRKYFKESA